MEQSGESRLKKREITLKDGRYLIFYTFEDEPTPLSESKETRRHEHKPRAEEKRRV